MSSGFVAGTLVHTDKGLIPIQNLQVGDLVLSKPEDGSGEAEFKPVISKFIYENKNLWMAKLKKHGNSFTQIKAKKSSEKIKILNSAFSDTDFLVTCNHPVRVVGKGIKKNEASVVLDEVVMYPEPHWKRVEQLEHYEIMINSDGVMYYIERAQPVYQFDTDLERLETKPSYMWYQDDYYGKEYDKYGNVVKYDTNGNWIEPDDYGNPDEYEELSQQALENKRNEGWVRNLDNYMEKGWLGSSVYGGVTPQNILKDEDGNYIPFTTTVYNLEVADNHNYYAGYGSLYVSDSTIQGTPE